MELTPAIKEMGLRPAKFPKLSTAFKKVVAIRSQGKTSPVDAVKSVVKAMKLSSDEEAGLVWKFAMSRKDPEKMFSNYYKKPLLFQSKEGKSMSGFNLAEAKNTFLKGRAQIAELFDRGQLKDLAPEVAEEILTAIAVVTAKAYEEQSGQPIEDEKELSQLVMASIKSLYRMRSPILMASRKVVRNPKSSQSKLKRSL